MSPFRQKVTRSAKEPERELLTSQGNMPKPFSFPIPPILSKNRKNYLLPIAMMFGFFTFFSSLPAQETAPRLRIVFELSSGNVDALKALSANVDGLQKNANNLAIISVIAFENGVLLLRTGNDENEKQLAALADSGVDLAVCRMSLENAEIRRSEILNFVRTVKVGAEELNQLEEQGWVRIREGESYVTDL